MAKGKVKWFNEKRASGLSKQTATGMCSLSKPPFRKLGSIS